MTFALRPIFVFFLLTVFIFTSLTHTVDDGFISDDFDMVYEVTRSDFSIAEHLIGNRYGVRGQGDVYRPIFVLSFLFDSLLYGKNPVGYHLTNSILYLLSCFFIFLVTRNILEKFKVEHGPLTALLTALFFAVSPLHSESVAWISGRTDVIAFFFILVSLFLFTEWERDKRRFTFIVSMLSFFLALGSKEMATVFPAVIFIYVFLSNHEERLKQRLKYAFSETFPFLIVFAISMTFRFLALGVFIGGYSHKPLFQTLELSVRAFTLNVGYLLAHWTASSRVPILLAFRAHPLAFFIALGLALLLVKQLLPKKNKRVFTWGVLTTFLFLIPVMSAPVDVFTHTGQRLVYFASFGFYFVFSLIFVQLLTKHRRALTGVVIILVISSITLFFKLNSEWGLAAEVQELLINETTSVFEYTKDPLIVMLDLPDKIGNAYVARNSLREALKLTTPDTSFELLTLPFYLNLTKDNWQQDVISWKQTSENFFEAEKKINETQLFMGLENTRNEAYATKIVSYDLEWNVGEKFWVEFSSEYFEKTKTRDIVYLFFNKGHLQTFPASHNTSVTEIVLPKDISFVDHILYHPRTEELFMVTRLTNQNQAVWSLNSHGIWQQKFSIPETFHNARLFTDTSNNLYYSTNFPPRLYRSDNDGISWKPVLKREEIFWATTDIDGNILATVWAKDRPIVYESSDNGNSWHVWKNFATIFPEEAQLTEIAGYNLPKMRHLHDIVSLPGELLVGTGDISRWTLRSRDRGVSWDKIWDEGFTAHITDTKKRFALLGGDGNLDYGIARYKFGDTRAETVWRPWELGWSKYIYSMLEKNDEYFAAVHIENNDQGEVLYYGIMRSRDGIHWNKLHELESTDANTTLYLANRWDKNIFASMNGKLYVVSR